LPILDEALRVGRRIRMLYERMYAEGPSERTVDPFGLVAKGSVWYLVAGIDDQVRTYRASRIRDVEVLDEAAVRPDDFDLAEFWGRSRAEFEAKLPTFDAVLRLSPTGLVKARAGFWRFTKLIAEGQPDGDGWTTCTVRADSIEVAHAMALGLGSEVEVVAPAELREAVLADAAAILDRVDASLPGEMRVKRPTLRGRNKAAPLASQRA
jgi:predicted DNA-binding transcriptional regulator YafY